MINADQQHPLDLSVPNSGERYALRAKLESTTIDVNGHTLRLDDQGNLPSITGEPVAAGRMSFAPASITFVALKDADNSNCR